MQNSGPQQNVSDLKQSGSCRSTSAVEPRREREKRERRGEKRSAVLTYRASTCCMVKKQCTVNWHNRIHTHSRVPTQSGKSQDFDLSKYLKNAISGKKKRKRSFFIDS